MRASTQQMEHVVILLHVVGLLVAAVPQDLVAAWEPALQPLGAVSPHRGCDVIRGREFAPVKGVEPLGSFAVTHKVHSVGAYG